MSRSMPRLNRRSLIAGFYGLGGLAVVGCSRSPRSGQAPSNAAAGQPKVQLPSMTVYRDPSCGCCEAWAEIARKVGYEVSVVDRPDMPATKARLGVPEALTSCHTTTASGYVVEGHVPMEDVARLLEQKPKGIRGIAVAGMPRGSPGMEMPDGSKDVFQVMSFDAAGITQVFRS